MSESENVVPAPSAEHAAPTDSAAPAPAAPPPPPVDALAPAVAEAQPPAPEAPAPAPAPDVSAPVVEAAPAPRAHAHGRREPRVAPTPAPYWNSYFAGVALGLVLLAAFVITGKGLGASGAMTRLTAHGLQATEAAIAGGTRGEQDTWARQNAYTSQYVNGESDTLDDFLLYMFVGVLAGGFISSVIAHRATLAVGMGPHTNVRRRLVLAAVGGVIAGFATRLARGCTSGQALTGGATLAVGSWAFMFAVFIGAYLLAYVVRKEWL